MKHFLIAMGVCCLVTALSAQDDPPQITIGERLFLETRFAQFFATNSPGNVNATLPVGDPVMNTTVTTGNSLAGPFAGFSMNCRACHLVDEHGANTNAGNRTYADFARRSPIPARGDGKTVALRNSPALVNSVLPRKGGVFLHFDGEFASTRDLVKGTFTGRNFGWLPGEQQQAIAHLARVIREDNGQGELAQAFGGLSYRDVLTGEDSAIPEEFQLPPLFTVDVKSASDKQIFNTVAQLVAAYVESLTFQQDEETGKFTGSPYDVFLRKNRLPRGPLNKESDLHYAQRLKKELDQLTAPQFVTTADGTFSFHAQPFQFGTNELAGLKMFLRQSGENGVGNCIACHAPPKFTDFKFHNTGVTQVEYDGIHSAGTFAALEIPDLVTRTANPEAYLPATAQHPGRQGPFLDVPAADKPGRTDLGVWNVFANPDHPRPQKRLSKLLCAPQRRCDPNDLLPLCIAAFKTPGLRDLSDSAPYMHTGRFETLTSVIEHYRAASELARAGELRNPDVEIVKIRLSTDEVDALVAFLRSLTEDYN